MTSHFCDVCGKKAFPLQRNTTIDSTLVYNGKEGKPDGTVITYNIHLGLKNHPTGYGGPADLCKSCFKKLVTEALNSLLA